MIFEAFGVVEIWCKSAGIPQNRVQVPAIPENMSSWPPYPQKHSLWPLTLFPRVRRVSNQREAFSTKPLAAASRWACRRQRSAMFVFGSKDAEIKEDSYPRLQEFL
jgi:hypothetical protein